MSSAAYTSAACNRSPHCLDWGRNGCIIYGACNAVIVYKPRECNGGEVEHTLVSHQKPVTSVRWICREKGEETELISTSADHTAIIWSCDGDKQFVPDVLKGHSNAVQIADAVYVQENTKRLLLVTASTDSTIKVWFRGDPGNQCVQTISFGHGFATELKLTYLQNFGDPLLAAAGDDCKIHLYSQNSQEQFILLAHLSGHEDWIHGLDFISENGDTLLATGSQDCYIRIWKISDKKLSSIKDTSSAPALKVRETVLNTCSGKKYFISLDTVISGHENWIYSVKWQRYTSPTTNSLRLMSTSMDKTVIVWELNSRSNLWQEMARIGEVGGNTLGFFGGVFSPNGEAILAHGFQGSMHMWCYSKELDSWCPRVPFGGHFGPVQDISWDPEGAYLLSCSMDQTTRLHAPWAEGEKLNWCEIARPQVHGYDMVCLSVLNRYKFVSGADEKILRVFKAPRSFAANLQNLCDIDTSTYLLDSLPEGASVPSLGLSNVAVFDEDIVSARNHSNETKHAKDKFPDFYYTPVLLTEPPTEDLLLQNTLWPEVQKLYGHPYEVFTVAADHRGSTVASACKASKMEHAAIILWNAKDFSKMGCLEFHTLTVTQMEFSPDDEYLLSVSRDRMWAVYQHFPNEMPPYRKMANLERKSAVHSRIIWSCSWSHDSLYFATSSRDKKVAVWERNTESSGEHFTLASHVLEAKDSVTAVCFAPCQSTDRYIVGVGLDNGQIYVYSWKNDESNSPVWNLHITLDNSHAHHLTVNRLRFSPLGRRQRIENGQVEQLHLASCGNDHLVRIYCFNLQLLTVK